jgi:hypothetical protein
MPALQDFPAEAKALPVAKEKNNSPRVETPTAQLANEKKAASAALSFATGVGVGVGVGVGLMALLMPRP